MSFVLIGGPGFSPTASYTWSADQTFSNIDVEGYSAFGNGSALNADQTVTIDRTFTTSGAGSNGFQIRIDGTIVAVAGGNNIIAGAYVGIVPVTDGGGTVTAIASLYIAGAPTYSGTVTAGPFALFVQDGDSRFDGAVQIGSPTAPSGDGDLSISGQLDVEGYAVIGNGSALVATNTLTIDRDFTTSSLVSRQLLVKGTQTHDAGTSDFHCLEVTSDFIVNSGGSHDAYTVFITTPALTETSGSFANSASIYLQGTPTEATNNYGLWSNSGITRLDAGGTTTLATATGNLLELTAGTINGSNASSTIAIGTPVALGVVTYTNDAATLTMTDVASMYIAGVPVASTNVTFTNTALALWVDAGEVRIDGDIGDTTNRVNKLWTVDQDTTNAENVSSWSMTKDNIHAYTERALDIIKSTSVITFNHLDQFDPSGRIKLGIRAESIREPLATPMKEYSGLGQGPGVDMMGLAALNTKAIQELIEENTELRQRVLALENR